MPLFHAPFSSWDGRKSGTSGGDLKRSHASPVRASFVCFFLTARLSIRITNWIILILNLNKFTPPSLLLLPRSYVKAPHSALTAGSPCRGHQPPVWSQQPGWKCPPRRTPDLHDQPQVAAPAANQSRPERHQGLLRDER